MTLKTNKSVVHDDILAISTKYTKIVLFSTGNLMSSIQNSNFFKILFKSTQPAHFITAASVLIVASLILPQTSEDSHQSENRSTFWSLVYLGAFSTHLGAQIWMTFISGLSLYFSIPRHIFGSVQKVLFPKYFLLNAVLSLTVLATFWKINKRNIGNYHVTLQALLLSVCFLIELIIRLYFTPPLLELITGKNEIEEKAGVGTEIGRFDPGSLLDSPDYLKLHKSFRKIHMTIAVGNIIAMACTMVHLYYLSTQFCNIQSF